MFVRLIAAMTILAGIAPFARPAAADGHAQAAQLTGDMLQGVPVITALDVGKLEAGKHYFYFRAGWRNSGQPLHVPVVVLKGEAPGKRLLLTAAVHGDELNGIGVVHELLAELDSAYLAGTVMAVPGLNQPGMNANNRRYVGAGGGGFMTDPNRNFPGTKSGGSTAGLYLGALWHGLIASNTDFAVDLHTQTRGTAYPLFVFADFKNSAAKAAAFALSPDMVKNDGGQKGTLETTLMEAGIPAVTFEVGAPKQFQHDLIDRAVGGIKNLMRQHKMLQGAVSAPQTAPIVGSSYSNVYAEAGGVAVIHVALKERVTRGQHVATLYDPFGRELKRYAAPHDGWVLALATDPLREAGSMLVRILQ